jgi:predicted O-methyltransferase YrrM
VSDAFERLQQLEEAAWALGAIAFLADVGVLGPQGLVTTATDEVAAARVLVALGLAKEPTDGGGFTLDPDFAELVSGEDWERRSAGLRSSLGQLMSVLKIEPATDAQGWAAQSDETLRAQGRASGLGGTMLARMAVPALEGLAERFEDGGRFLDVGVGVAELSAAFAEALPSARVVGIDVLPRALAMAEETVRERGLADRIELRRVGVQELDDVEAFDLAWLPAPFIPEEVFDDGLGRLFAALRPGGWIVVGSGRLEGDGLPQALTRWKTQIGGGTALPAAEAEARLTAAGFADVAQIPTPPGTPVLYAGRRPANGG